jgi:hypothetical protein
MRQQGRLITLPPQLSTHDITKHVLAAAKTPIILFHAASIEAGLSSRILAVAAGAPAAWPDQAVASPHLFDGLAGAVARVGELTSALNLTHRTDRSGLAQAVAMADAGHWRETWRRPGLFAGAPGLRPGDSS